MKTVAIIPIKGNSKRIKNKNIKKFMANLFIDIYWIRYQNVILTLYISTQILIK